MPLAWKLAKIMGEVKYIQKRGWNDFHKYHYVTEGDLVSAIRPLLASAGIIIIPSVVEEGRLQDVIQERSGMSSLSTVVIEYTVTDGKETFTFRMPGHGADRGDKGIYKAITGSMKYALMKLFEVETGDDPERETGSAPEETSDAGVSITSSHEEGIEKGGRSKNATRYQLQRISSTMREKGIDRTALLDLIKGQMGVELQLPDDEAERSKTILTFLSELEYDEAGALIRALDEWSEGDGVA